MTDMREILFRGKRTDNGEWIEGQLAYFFDKKDNPYIMPRCYFATREFNEEDSEDNDVISNEIAFGGFISVIPETVGQCTGLTDRNGNKIFEGDKNQRGYVILWNKEKCLFAEHYLSQLDGTYIVASYPIYDTERIEIIGTIHD